METGTIRVKTKEDVEKFIKKKLTGYQGIKMDFEQGNSGRVYVTARNDQTPKGKVELFLFQFFIEK